MVADASAQSLADDNAVMPPEAGGVSQENASAEPAPLLPGIGQQLRRARESRGLDVSGLAAQLKLTVRQVEALEADEHILLPNTIIRGFVRNYARLVGIDAAPLMKQMDRESHPPDVNLEIHIGPEVHDEKQISQHDRARIIFGGGVLLLAIVVYFLLPQDGWQSGQNFLNSLTRQNEDSVTPATPVAQEKSMPPSPPAATPPVDAESPKKPEEHALSYPLPEPVPTNATASASVQAVSQPAPAIKNTSGTRLRFSFAGDSWVEIRNRNNEVIYSQLNVGGTTREIDGQPPFSLIVGNASHVRLEYRGQLVAFPKRSKEDVARMTLE